MKFLVGSAHFGYTFVGSAAAPFGARPTPHLFPYSSSLPPIPPHHYYLSPHLQRPCPNRRQSYLLNPPPPPLCLCLCPRPDQPPRRLEPSRRLTHLLRNHHRRGHLQWTPLPTLTSSRTLEELGVPPSLVHGRDRLPSSPCAVPVRPNGPTSPS